MSILVDCTYRYCCVIICPPVIVAKVVSADGDAGFATEYLGEAEGDVRGLKGVSDELEDAMMEQAKKSTGGPADLEAPIQAVADDADDKDPVLCHAVAMYDFAGSDPSRELALKAGNVIEVTEMDNSDGWWHGRIGDKWGAFPFSYVHCVIRHAAKDYLLLPSGWKVHEAAGSKAVVGTWDPSTKQLTASPRR